MTDSTSTNLNDKSTPEMTGEDMRRLARDVGERATDAATEPGGGVSLADVLALSNALCEAEARLSRVLDELDPRDANVPTCIVGMILIHMGLRPAPTACCLEHLEFVRTCRACCGALWMRRATGVASPPRGGEIRATVVGGPIEMRDYDYLQLAQTHTAVCPDGSTLDMPPGTKLVRHGVDGVGVEQPNGLCNRGRTGDHPTSPKA